MKGNVYIKSFEKDFILKTVVGNEKQPAQSVQNVLETKVIKPNTLSFGKEKRLASAILHENYQKTYRSQGIIFQTNARPSVIYPFDMVLLTDAKKIVVQYYRIKDKLHEYYRHKLIKGSNQFAFKSFQEMIKAFPNPEAVWKAVNAFRAKAGYGRLPKPKHKLIEYCEAIFNKPVHIKPVAVYGYSKASTAIAKKYGLPHYASAKKFYEKSAAARAKQPRQARKRIVKKKAILKRRRK